MRFTWLACVIFLGLPLLVIPGFLDYSQTPKTLGIAIALFITICGATLGLAPRSPFKGPTGHLNGIGMAFWVIGGVCLLGLSQSNNALAAFDKLIWIGCALYLGVWAGRLLSFDDILRWVSLGTGVVAAFGLLQVLFDVQYLVPTSDPGQFPAVTFGNRGLASLFVALGVLPTWVKCRETTQHPWTWGVLLILQLAFVGLAMTRSVWLGLGLAAMVFLIWTYRNAHAKFFGWRLLSTLFVAVVASAAFIWNNDALRILLGHRLDPANWLQNPRLVVWGKAADHFVNATATSQWLGMGLGDFVASQQVWLANTSMAGQTYLHLHNDVLELIWNFGWLGFFLLGALLIWGLRLAFRYSHSPGQKALTCNVLLILVSSLLFYPLSLPFFVLLFTIFLSKRWDYDRKYDYSWGAGFRVKQLVPLVAATLILLLAGSRVMVELSFRQLVDRHGAFTTRLQTKYEMQQILSHLPAPEVYQRMIR